MVLIIALRLSTYPLPHPHLSFFGSRPIFRGGKTPKINPVPRTPRKSKFAASPTYDSVSIPVATID